MKEYIALLKIGKLDHLVHLRDRGCLHCKPAIYFSELEDNIRRGDELEGVTAIMNLDGGSLRMKNVDAPDSDYSAPIHVEKGKMLQSADSARGNIFCLYAISADKHELGDAHIITNEAKAFGDHFLIIKNYPEFLKRIATKLEELSMTGNYGFITYKDFATYSGRKTHFEKDIAFQHQHEFRIFIKNLVGNVLDLEIGSIADISEVGSCVDLEAITFYDLDDNNHYSQS